MIDSIKTILEEVLKNLEDDSEKMAEAFEKLTDVKDQEQVLMINGWIINSCDQIRKLLNGDLKKDLI